MHVTLGRQSKQTTRADIVVEVVVVVVVGRGCSLGVGDPFRQATAGRQRSAADNKTCAELSDLYRLRRRPHLY